MNSKEQDIIKNIVDIVGEEVEDANDSPLLKDLSQRFAKIKMNMAMKKKLAKELNLDEKQALDWEIVSDVLACVDTSRLAKEYPEECAKIVKCVAGIVGLFVPFAWVIEAFPPKLCAKVVEYSGLLTPEHIGKKLAEKEIAEKKLVDNEKKTEETDNQLH